MPIAPGDLNRDFEEFDEHLPLQQALDQINAGPSSPAYLVVRFAGGRFAILSRRELTQALAALPARDRASALKARLGDLFAGLAAAPIEQASIDPFFDLNYALLQAPDGRRVVVDGGGQVAGILTEAPATFRGIDDAWAKGGLTLRGEPEPEAEAAAEAESRWINVELRDEAMQTVDPRTKPLQPGQTYNLSFDVDVEARARSLLENALFEYRFREGEAEVDITIRLESSDFEILTEPQKLRVPRNGKSKNKARFDVVPRKEGPAVINAVLLKDGNFVQLLTLKFTVVEGEMFAQEALGRPVEAAFLIRPRNLNLTILHNGAAFQLIMSGAVAATATLPISRDYLRAKINQARQVLQKDVVYMRDSAGTLIYQAGIDIPPEANREALRRLADVGYGLYTDIFYGPDAGAQANLLGDRLRQMAKEDRLKIQIFSQHFNLPWGLLYMADEDEYDPDHIRPELFLGLKHIIEHIPLQPSMQVTDRRIDSVSGLAVSLNVNTDIDQQTNYPLIANQVEYWDKIKEIGGAQVVLRKTPDDVLQALKSADTSDQLLYFYCHAVSRDLEEEGGVEESFLKMTGGGRLTLKDLKRFASARKPLPGEPLVFINACESAELSPLFYDGFVPYFMQKGARGVIGTECETPALFALEWANRFFDRFLSGEPLGQIFLELRQEFYQRHNNLLGLLYALYVDGDTQVVPGLRLPDAG